MQSPARPRDGGVLMRVLLLSREINSSHFGLSRLLDQDASVNHVDISDDIRSAVDADIVILEGLAAAELFTPRLRSETCTRIVVLARSDTEQRIRLLDDGADLVLRDIVPAHEIVALVRAIARRGAAPPRRVVRPRHKTSHIVLDTSRRQAVVLGRRIALTLLEGNLLAAFIARPGEVLDGRALMTTVWGSPSGARSTLSAYIRRLRLKIEPDPSNPIFIRTVWGGGYVYRPDIEEPGGEPGRAVGTQ